MGVVLERNRHYETKSGKLQGTVFRQGPNSTLTRKRPAV